VRVAFCIDNMGPGGTESNAVRTVEAMDRERFDVTMVTLRADGVMRPRYDAAGVPVVAFPITSLTGLSTLRQVRALAAFLRRERFDVVHSHDRYNNIFATVAARLAGVPAVICSKRWMESTTGFLVANAVAYRLADCVLANSSAVAESLRHVERVPSARVAVVPNFVTDAAFEGLAAGERERLLAELGVPADALVVGMVARLRMVKNHESLFRAAARLRQEFPAVRVVLVGDGGSRDDLEALTREIGVADIVHFAGHRDQRLNLNRLFDVSVLCSLSEGFPNAVVEAMAAARPVVATRVGGIPDAIDHGETGLLVPPRAPDALAEAIGSLLRDPARRAAMGAAAQRAARDRFLASSVLPRLYALYDRLLSRRAHGGHAPSESAASESAASEAGALEPRRA
jgi:glycosyltransferase involved in cell wall biosynthesis